jgi:hypothetical protein
LESDKEVSGKVPGNIERFQRHQKRSGNVPDFIEVVSVKELCQGLII